MSLIPLCLAGREVAWSSPTGDRQAEEVPVGAQHHHHCLLGSTSSAILQREWLLMDLGDLGAPQDMDTGMGLPRTKARNRGSRSSSRERRWKGTWGHIQSWGKKGDSYLPPLRASLDGGRGESGLLMHEAAH